jgi:predicted nucleotidyltransferase
MQDDDLQQHAAAINDVARSHGAREVRIFGSRTRSESTSESDVDLLVSLEPGRDLLDLVAIKQEVEALLGCPVDVVEEEGLSPYLRDEILRQARPL